MNAQTKITAAEFPRFDAMAAYERERDENRRLFEVLGSVLFVADHMADKLERAGDDMSVTKRILAQARQERLA